MLKTPRTLLLTGATSGIGLALLKQLLRQGHHLIVVARDKSKLQELQNRYERVTSYTCDFSSRLQLETVMDEISEKHTELSMVINNAGVQCNPSFLDKDFNYESIEYETTVNFLAPVWISCLLLPLLLRSKNSAAIVNISSGLVFAPKTASAVYCATKAAIHSVSQSLRYQLSETAIQVHEVILPLVDTAMTAGRGNGKMSSNEAARQIIAGLMKNKVEIYVGKARFLPLLARLSPSLLKRIMKKY